MKKAPIASKTSWVDCGGGIGKYIKKGKTMRQRGKRGGEGENCIKTHQKRQCDLEAQQRRKKGGGASRVHALALKRMWLRREYMKQGGEICRLGSYLGF